MRRARWIYRALARCRMKALVPGVRGVAADQHELAHLRGRNGANQHYVDTAGGGRRWTICRERAAGDFA